MEKRLVGRYALYSQFASGGMASVHFGRLSGALGFARTVAIKRLHAQFANEPEFVAMFLDEARLASRIHHPNVVSTLDVVSEEEQLFLVMEYVPGESLAHLLRDAPDTDPLPPEYAVGIVIDALHGLHAAHEAKSAAGQPLAIVHRDVSPHNVLVGVDGGARIIDFGIAKAIERVHMTRGSDLRGKIGYMPPERVRRERVDRRTDVYAAAVVLWEALTRRRFIEVENEAAAVTAVLERAPEAPSAIVPGLPRGLDEVVLKGMAKDPGARYATALEMATALEKALAPAGKREIGHWVARTAQRPLAERASSLAAIETDQDEIDPDRSAPLLSSVTSTGSAPDVEVFVHEPPQASRWAWPIATALAAAIVANLAFLGVKHVTHVPPPPAAVVSTPTVVVATPAPPAAPEEPAPPPAAPAARTVRAKAHPSAKSAACKQPFTFDHGIKVPKLECL